MSCGRRVPTGQSGLSCGHTLNPTYLGKLQRVDIQVQAELLLWLVGGRKPKVLGKQVPAIQAFLRVWVPDALQLLG